mmetsp:Transcript_21729/g.51307  ORF Transcript_21729/g.51307 Transcript_21729/m.51307 type:complete len:209 (+) Transcript_21729:66-692(+)
MLRYPLPRTLNSTVCVSVSGVTLNSTSNACLINRSVSIEYCDNVPTRILDTSSGPSDISRNANDWQLVSIQPPRRISSNNKHAPRFPRSSGSSVPRLDPLLVFELSIHASAVRITPVVDSLDTTNCSPGDGPQPWFFIVWTSVWIHTSGNNLWNTPLAEYATRAAILLETILHDVAVPRIRLIFPGSTQSIDWSSRTMGNVTTTHPDP